MMGLKLEPLRLNHVEHVPILRLSLEARFCFTLTKRVITPLALRLFISCAHMQLSCCVALKPEGKSLRCML